MIRILRFHSARDHLSALLSLHHGDLVLHKIAVPLLFCHLGNTERAVMMNLIYHLEKLLIIEGWKTWIRYGPIFKYMISEQELVVQALPKLWHTCCFQE